MARRRHDSWGWDSYPVSRPREAKGGIKAQTQRGAFGASWWAKRWVTVLESFNIGARLSRGKSYARRGQVTDIQVSEGLVTASVQGSRPRPYRVTIKMKTLSPTEWATVVDGLGTQAIYAAKLLSGEMPQDIEEVLTAAGLSLFPSRIADLETACSCPDWSNPCKHIAAVFYLLGEEFDRDPFLIFTLRGMGRDELMTRLGEAVPAGELTQGQADISAMPGAVTASEPLPADCGAFWGAHESLSFIGEIRPGRGAALPRRLGAFPFWRSSPPLLSTLEHVYDAASSFAVDLLAGGFPAPQEPSALD